MSSSGDDARRLLDAGKRRTYTSDTFPWRQLIFVDGVGLLVTLAPVTLTWALVLAYVHWAWPRSWFALWALLTLPVAGASFLLLVGLFHRLLPRVKPGVYRIGTSGFRAWYYNLCLENAVRISGLQPLFDTFYITKFALWRAFGADVPYGVNSSLFATFRDYPLLSIGRGSTFGLGVLVTAHWFVGDRVMLRPVTIGANVFVGVDCRIGPGTVLDDGVWIGSHNTISGEHLTSETRVEPFTRNGNEASGERAT